MSIARNSVHESIIELNRSAHAVRHTHTYLLGVLFGHLLLVAPQRAVCLAHCHDHVRVVPPHPRLVVQAGHVEGFAGIGQSLVVLFQDLVEPGEVQINKFLQSGADRNTSMQSNLISSGGYTSSDIHSNKVPDVLSESYLLEKVIASFSHNRSEGVDLLRGHRVQVRQLAVELG